MLRRDLAESETEVLGEREEAFICLDARVVITQKRVRRGTDITVPGHKQVTEPKPRPSVLVFVAERLVGESLHGGRREMLVRRETGNGNLIIYQIGSSTANASRMQPPHLTPSPTNVHGLLFPLIHFCKAERSLKTTMEPRERRTPSPRLKAVESFQFSRYRTGHCE